MITLTDAARTRLLEMLKAEGHEGYAIRLRVRGRDNRNYVYDFRPVKHSDKGAGDEVVDADGLTIYLDPATAQRVQGATVGLSVEQMGRLVIDNPNTVWQDEAASAVADLIEDRINPSIAVHGGRVALVDYDEHIAYIDMQGGCQGCGLATVTLRQGIERLILDEVPTVKSIVDVTAHEQGENPFFRRGQEGGSPLIKE
ncbi:MAG: iron-sulfur cluster assembly accessory protein [Chloroflexi bacterium]|nr:iron-sulfur cluster assembly accessory protein [Chloroflexota bacterium]